MPYGQDVPIVHASAGMKRAVALAYLLVWCWHEHVKASELLDLETTRQVIFIIDEAEAHLHPRWQRVILRALMDVVGELMGTNRAQVQILTATHSPLVLASVESMFEDGKDAWFDLDLVARTSKGSPQVVLQQRPWVRCGD